MGSAIGRILPYAVGAALSPVPGIAMILMLFSSRARIVAPAQSCLAKGLGAWPVEHRAGGSSPGASTTR